jgi:hypothetical protein
MRVLSSVSGGGYTASAYVTHCAAQLTPTTDKKRDAKRLCAAALESLHAQMQRHCGYMRHKHVAVVFVFSLLFNLVAGSFARFVVLLMPLSFALRYWLDSADVPLFRGASHSESLATLFGVAAAALLLFVLATLTRRHSSRAAAGLKLIGFLLSFIVSPMIFSYIVGLLVFLGDVSEGAWLATTAVLALAFPAQLAGNATSMLGLGPGLAFVLSVSGVWSVVLNGTSCATALETLRLDCFCAERTQLDTARWVWLAFFIATKVNMLVDGGHLINWIYTRQLRTSFYANQADPTVGKAGTDALRVGGPYYYCCCALSGLDSTASLDGAVAPFIFAPYHVGSPFVSTDTAHSWQFSPDAHKLADAMGLSGAAFATSVGRNRAARFVNTFRAVFAALGLTMGDYLEAPLMPHLRFTWRQRAVPFVMTLIAGSLMVAGMFADVALNPQSTAEVCDNMDDGDSALAPPTQIVANVMPVLIVLAYCIAFFTYVLAMLNFDRHQAFVSKSFALMFDALGIVLPTTPTPPAYLRVTDGGHDNNLGLMQVLTLPPERRLAHIFALDAGFDAPQTQNGNMFECGDLWAVIRDLSARGFQFDQINSADSASGALFRPRAADDGAAPGPAYESPVLIIRVRYPRSEEHTSTTITSSMIYYIHMDTLTSAERSAAQQAVKHSEYKLPEQLSPWHVTENQFLTHEQFCNVKLTGFGVMKKALERIAAHRQSGSSIV